MQASIGHSLKEENKTSGNGGGRGPRTLNQDQQVELVGPFLKEEVQAAIKGLNAEGAPSLDGLPEFFYNKFWGLFRPGVMATLKNF